MAFSLKKLFKQAKQTATASTSNQTSVVGIDIGSSSIKVVELEQREDFVALKTYGELQLGPYADKPLGSQVTLSHEQRVEALVDVLRESGVKAKQGVLALPLSLSFVTVVTIPEEEGTDGGVGARVRVEARKYIPVPLKEVTLEWSPLPKLQEDAAQQTEVLIAAVQNESYGEINQLLTAVELASQPTEIELFCAQRAANQGADMTYAILDLGAQTTKLYIVHEGMMRKIHRVFAGGEQVTQHLATALGVSFVEGENIKRSPDTDAQTAQLQETIANTYKRPLSEIDRALTHFVSENGLELSKVFVVGGGATSQEVLSFVDESLRYTCTPLSAFASVAYPAFMEDTLTEIGPAFGVALGAAMRSIER